MLIKNLTMEKHTIVVKEIAGERREYDICISGGGSTNLDKSLVVAHPELYAGIFEFEGNTPVVIEKPSVVSEPVTQEVEDPEIIDNVEKEEEPATEADSFICDICGAEFASARGLNSHKNKAHA